MGAFLIIYFFLRTRRIFPYIFSPNDCHNTICDNTYKSTYDIVPTFAALSGGGVVVGTDEPTVFGVIISALEVIHTQFSGVDIATIAEGINQT